jgi:hypothetical protein
MRRRNRHNWPPELAMAAGLRPYDPIASFQHFPGKEEVPVTM